MKEVEAVGRRSLCVQADISQKADVDNLVQRVMAEFGTIDILVNRAVALRAADGLGITATVEEVQAEIAVMPAFQLDGRFNKEQYVKVLSANRLKPGPFEKTVGDDIISSKVRASITSDVTVSDEEVKAAYLSEFREVDLKFVGFDPETYRSGIEVADEEAGKYLEACGRHKITCLNRR